MSRVYLAGPITGLTFEGCTDWREYAVKELDKVGITGLSPMRAKDYLSSMSVIGDNYDGRKDINPLADILSGSRGITTRDRWDTTRCDVILANFLGAEKVSIGTVMEIAWADSVRTPSIVVMEPEGNVHDHAMIRECIGFRVETLEEGLAVAKAILLP
jgi:nucleoside 2-deoxyribosyltransferase